MRITRVQKNSISCELGIKPNSQVLAFDGFDMIDLFDYEFYNGEEEFVLTVKDEKGRVTDYEIEKEFDEDLGLEFEDTIKVRQCKNKCIFCFVDQLPKDDRIRDTLKIKDDDYRHSLIYGNFITLTNMTDEDFERIARLQLSPLYVSVHSIDDEIRRYMMGRNYDGEIKEQLEFLSEEGIEIHAQIVYCPKVNEDLDETIEELAETCASLAIVPVGLTKNCNKALKPVTKEIAEKIIKLVEKKQKHFLELYGTRFVWAADEFYLLAGKKIPLNMSYEDYPQTGNGVGLIAKFDEEFSTALKFRKDLKIDAVSIVTGESAYEFIKEKAQILMDKFGGNIQVHKIENEFFGKSVTVAGLVVGSDIINQLKGKTLGNRLLIPYTMLKDSETLFLDNTSISDVEKALNIKITVIDVSGKDFINKIKL
ncbi:MAG: DUF512 domain-containing protein [Firmicutes bacterium]|nr:DUF512 domain-containing protein [Bacillota bacterium]